MDRVFPYIHNLGYRGSCGPSGREGALFNTIFLRPLNFKYNMNNIYDEINYLIQEECIYDHIHQTIIEIADENTRVQIQCGYVKVL